VSLRLKARTVEEEITSIIKQRQCKHVSVATEANAPVEELLNKKHATIEELLEAVFSMRGAQVPLTGDRNGTAVTC
jgi:hypothetical protein